MGEDQPERPVTIRVDTPSPWVPNTRCAKLAECMMQARAEFRQNRPGVAAATQEALRRAFGTLFDTGSFSVLGVHDDCQARRWHGKPPSPCVDVALCDSATREATREVMSALAAHGAKSWTLSAGPMCHLITEKVRDVITRADQDGGGGGHSLMLISAHDTSIFTLLNALSEDFRTACTTGERGGVWPPYWSTVTIDVLRNHRVRLLYQFEPLSQFAQGGGGGGGGGKGGGGGAGGGGGGVGGGGGGGHGAASARGSGVEDVHAFLRRLDVVALSPHQFREQCPVLFESAAGGEGPGTVVFSWGA